MAVASSGAGCEHGCCRQTYRGGEIDGAIERVADCAAQPGKYNGDQAGAMRLMLAEFEDTHHQRNHNQATANSKNTTKKSGDKPNDKTDNIIFHARLPFYHIVG